MMFYPKQHKGRNEIVKQVTRLRKDLIRLDVLCQDIEWEFTSARGTWKI